jgi:preprotein translocase subunit SecE
MAKTRAQRKAERRKRQQQLEREGKSADGGAQREQESRAQHDTQVPRSGEEAEFEAVMETGAQTEEYGEQTVERDDQDAVAQADSPVPGVVPAPVRPEPPAEPEPPPEPEAPAPSRADVGQPIQDPTEVAPPPRETREARRARKQREKEERRKARAREQQKGQAEKAEKRRGAVTGFIASCWAELKRVQWPDRDTLVQASAVTLIFVVIMAAYLGGLDAAFNWLVKQIL